MKKSLFVITAIILISLSSHAQGVLKDRYYGTFSAQEVDALAQGGDPAIDAKFNERANTTADTWRTWLEQHVYQNTGKSLLEVLDNSDVISLSGSVRTVGTNFSSWFNRQAYTNLGEQGFRYIPTGWVYLSTACLNMTNNIVMPQAPPINRQPGRELQQPSYQSDNQPTYSNYNVQYADYRNPERVVTREVIREVPVDNSRQDRRESRPRVHWTEGVANVGTGVGRFLGGVAATRVAFGGLKINQNINTYNYHDVRVRGYVRQISPLPGGQGPWQTGNGPIVGQLTPGDYYNGTGTVVQPQYPTTWGTSNQQGSGYSNGWRQSSGGFVSGF